MRYVVSSSYGMASRSMSVPRRALMAASASWMTVSVVSPRKSIFSMPACSSMFMSYCVTTTRSSLPEPDPLDSCVQIGTYSSSGPGAMTMPAG